MTIPMATGSPPVSSDDWDGSVPVRPTDFNSTDEIRNILYNIDESLMGKHIQALQDVGTRYSYRGDKCYQAADYIATVFERNGLDVYYDDFTLNTVVKMRNVVGVKPGTSTSNGTVIICGHYDTFSPGSYPWTDAPGADDNGSGVAAVMAAAEILSDYQFNLTIKFIAFDGEEQGLKGSYNYVSGAVAAGENITAVINLDMIAYNPDPGTVEVYIYEGNNGNSSWLKSFMGDIAVKYQHISRIQLVDAGRIWASDHHSFSAHFQSILLIERRFGSNPNYHRITDTIDKLNLTYCANITQVALAAVSELAGISSQDSMPPSHTPGTPSNGSYATATPNISIEVTDPGSVDAASVKFIVDGTQVTPAIHIIPLGLNFSYAPPTPFPDGKIVDISVSAADMLGNNFTHNWSFMVDAVFPEPPSNFGIESARIGAVKQGLNLDIDSPSDSKHALAPSVIYRDGEYKMWYMASNSSIYHISYANSSDGLTWQKHGVVLLYGVTGQPDDAHVGHHEVIFDGEYKMWYSGYNGTAWRIMYANSSDGINWVKHGVVLDLGLPGSLDATYALSPAVIKTDEYKMWYTGYDGLKYSILYANSSDGINWVKQNESQLSPGGPGKRWGDAIIAYPTVIHDNGTYHMWYNRVGSNYYQTHYASSSDGLTWEDQGIAIEASVDIGTPDRFQATYVSAMVVGNETKLWYSGFDGTNWRILFANITPQDPADDLTLSWTPSSSTDVVGYEIFRESRPSAFRQPMVRASPEKYTQPNGVTPWIFETEEINNVTAYGPVAGTDPPSFYLPDDNLIDLALYIRSGVGEWTKLMGGAGYSLDSVLGYVEILSPLFGPGCTFHAWYNHSGGRALRVDGQTVSDIRAGSASLLSYYYVIRAVDRAGNIAYCQDTVGKIATETSNPWTLLGNPFLTGQVPISEALAGLDWTAAKTWVPDNAPHQWTSNVPGRPPALNTLQTVNQTTGVWVRVENSNYYVAIGTVSNISINLSPGWNLVSYPYHKMMSVSQALAGVPWDRVEIMDQYSPGLITEIYDSDTLYPGSGFWVYVTSSAVWNAINVP
ncbi:MAG: M20/M25/M40 family metallo-hydrolase [Candidatus Thermoplasmatota archaeon]|nr:M20/M25/M40 family metallo-hydrolase [Candidatus Thermoplasmatota archaeon]MBU4143375.1 M20/M25/M40 family metallo-hydrolase [Candidatus Thermoplasmatota archaeon]MBU4591201.1 M20/M25/M40 family metallo-hydrolase [Candidatus Thermoplasmatota archaeon]